MSSFNNSSGSGSGSDSHVSVVDIQIASSSSSSSSTSCSSIATSIGKEEKEEDEVMVLCDFDLNLLNDDFKDISAELIEDSRVKYGIKYFVVPGSTLEDSRQAVEVSRKYQSSRDRDEKTSSSSPSSSSLGIHILPTCGVHPYNAPMTPLDADSLMDLENLVAMDTCLAVGECGLDYSAGIIGGIKEELEKLIEKNSSPVNGISKDGISDAKIIEIQKSWFKRQIDLSIKHDKPLFLHSRDAHSDFVEILSSYPQIMPLASPLPDSSSSSSSSSCNSLVSPELSASTNSNMSLKAVVHCFTGSTEELRQLLDMGFLIGLTGSIYRMKDRELKTWLDMITLQRLVLETDAPWMGFKNCTSLCSLTSARKASGVKSPANVPSALVLIVERVSKVGGWTKQEVARATTRNALRFLRYL